MCIGGNAGNLRFSDSDQGGERGDSLRRGARFFRHLVGVSLIATTLVTVGVSSGARAAAPLKIPGNFVYVDKVVDGRCLWGIGVEFPSVPGANSYSVNYYDGLYRAKEYGSVPVPVPASDRAGSLNYFGITGGGGPGPCVSDATENGRFTKTPVVYANFPGKTPDLGAISGMVTDKDGNPVGGVTVTAYGPTHASAESGPGGLYYMTVDKGSYRVVPDATALKGTSVSPVVRSVSVLPLATTGANFVVDGGLTVDLNFSKYAVPANGTEIVQASIKTTLFGKPAPGTNVELSVDPTDIASSLTTDPKVNVCGPSGRIWPTGPNVTDLSDVPVTVTTDSAGVYDFSLTVGTRPGSWSLDAWAKNDDGTLSADTLRASETKTLDVTALTPSLALGSVVDELNLIKSTTLSSQLDPQNPGNLRTLLSTLAANPSSGLNFGGLTFSVGTGADGYNVVIAPATTEFTIESSGKIKATGPVLSSLIVDPGEWTGSSLSSTLGNVASLDTVAQAGALPDLPSVSDWLHAGGVPSWKLTTQKGLFVATNSLTDFGWAYAPPGAWPKGYCN
jgi:hypothetical protein